MVFFLIAGLLWQQPAKPDPDREIQRIAMEGWNAARALAPKGGAVELLGPVNVWLRELDQFPNMSARYAEVAIRAAVSAAPPGANGTMMRTVRVGHSCADAHDGASSDGASRTTASASA